MTIRQTIATSVIAILCGVGAYWLQVPQLRRVITSSQNVSPAQLEREVEAERLRLNFLEKVPAFGFDNLMSNWVFLNFLQYFGDDEARAKTGYGISPDYFEVILKHDPRFLQAYLALSVSTSMYAGMPERSVGLMEKGLKFVAPQAPKRSYYIWRYKGIDELLFLGNDQAARQSFEKAAEWASTYTDDESKQVAEISRRTADFLARNPNSISAQIAAWSMVLNNQVDERTRKIAIGKIQELGGQVVVTPEGRIRISIPVEN
jgi:hypothetical protein